MKKINFILQGKGGVGKSLLTTFIADYELNNTKSIFLDLDSENKTLFKTIAPKLGKDRVKTISLLDEKSKDLKNENLLSILETAAEKEEFENFYFDFGGRESSALLNLTKSTDYTLDFIREIGIDLDLEVNYLIIVGGDKTDYKSCLDFAYYFALFAQNKEQIKVILNEYSFSNEELLIKTEEIFKKEGVKTFRLTSINSERGMKMLYKIQQNIPLQLMDKPPYMNMLKCVFNILNER
ncbi:MAG: hypothetical protein K2Q03_04245 [Sphingobacteriaceae bacterium]|nr:hypothetical protein [Sphingobacteriaceae bacterium]